MAARIRRDVYSLSPNGPELTWYGRAIAALKLLPRTQPGSWEFIGACHGLRSNISTPAAANGLWRQCQHQTWFFLPWHRAYLAGFEAIIAAQIVKLGGPANWALPYWNYSAPGAQFRQLPPAFRNQFSSPGVRNPLWSPRNQPLPPQTVLAIPTSSTNLSALNATKFSGSASSANPGFGGPQTAQATHFGQQFGLLSGQLEDLPHNVIHGDIGGLMNDPDLAALDPIFWLHHCNIDRLWEVWRRSRTPAVADPKQEQWLSSVKFKILIDKSTPMTFASRQALNTQTLLHGYKYDSVPAVLPVGAAPVAKKVAKKKSVKKSQDEVVSLNTDIAAPEVIASNDETVTLGNKRTQTAVRFAPGTAKRKAVKALAGKPQPEAPTHFLLGLENVTAKGPARDYRVFIDVPTDDRTPLEVGVLATFGVGTASDDSGPHGGSGLTKVIDITDAIVELGIGEDDFNQLRVTFEPIKRGKVEDIPDDFPYGKDVLKEPSELKVGSVKVFVE